MAVATATNCLTRAEDILRDMLTNTSAFQEWVSAISVAQAEEGVFFHSVPEPEDTTIPDYSETHSRYFWDRTKNFAIVATAPENGFSFGYAAAPNEFLATEGVLSLALYRWFDTVDRREDEDTRTALNEIGDILTAVLDLAGTAGYFSVNWLRVIAMDWEHEDQQPDTSRQFRVLCDVEWSQGNEGTL